MTETPISIEAAQKSVPKVVQPEEPAFMPMTPEEKSLHVTRLQKEGRWPKFCTRREEIRLEQKAKGVRGPQANETSWRQALEEFPPEKEEPKEPEATEETLRRLEENSSDIDIRKDVEEAFRKLRVGGLSINSFDREGAYLFWKGYKDSIRDFLKEYGVKYLGKSSDENDPKKRDERDVELDDLHTAMEKEFPVEGEKVACPACSVQLQLPNSLRTGDDAKSPQFHLRVA
jgi:hypothetical protein